jgi:hypothetical protein
MRPRLPLLLALMIACCTPPAIGRAAQKPSEADIERSHHLKGLFELPNGDLPTALLESVLKKQAQSLLLNKDQLKRPENQERLGQELKKLSELIQVLGKKDPRLADLAETMKALDASTPESVQELLKQLPREWQPAANAQRGFEMTRPGERNSIRLPQGEAGTGSGDERQRTESSQPESRQADAGSRSSAKPLRPPPLTPRQTPESENSGPEDSVISPVSPWAQRLVEGVSRFQALHPTLNRSEALTQAIQNLSRSVGQGDPRWQQLTERTAKVRENLERWKPDLNKLGIRRLSWPKGLPQPSLPQVRFPETTPPLGPVSVSPARPGASKWPLMLGLVGLVAVGILFWRMRAGGRELSPQQTRWRPGPWPVNPAAVATREELIRAFEYLSLLRLGRAARTWNHRTIARQLATPSAGNFGAAGSRGAFLGEIGPMPEIDPGVRALADVYEQARYAPLADELPPAALAAARTELCLLAGVSAS